MRLLQPADVLFRDLDERIDDGPALLVAGQALSPAPVRAGARVQHRGVLLI